MAAWGTTDTEPPPPGFNGLSGGLWPEVRRPEE